MILQAKQFAALLRLAETLSAERRLNDAQTLLQHLHSIAPADPEVLQCLVDVLADQDRIPDALRAVTLAAQKSNCHAEPENLRRLGMRAMERYNAALAQGDVDHAAEIAEGLIPIAPLNAAILNAAMECNLALGRLDGAAAHAQALLALDAGHAGASACLSKVTQGQASDHARKAVDLALKPIDGTHPLIRLRDIHDATGLLMCGPLSETDAALVEKLLSAADSVSTGLPPEHELAGWEKHYRLALEALRIPLTPPNVPLPDLLGACELRTAGGAALPWGSAGEYARRAGAKIVFFVAADMAYVKQYAAIFVKSLRKHCDVPFLAVVHVIGGASRLEEAAAAIGYFGPELLLAGDKFDAGAVQTKCFDTPPRGLSAKPLAHFQSVRFLRLSAILRAFELPVFVSDIDLLLQRGVADLLERCAECDVVLNENTGNANAGSRITANLLLLRPAAGAFLFLDGLENYLRRALSGAEVSRWIDQFALFMTRLHVVRSGDAVHIGYFDTESDINNLMYRSFQTNPFRFLSLYHGFDMSSLDDAADDATELQAKAG